MQSACSMSVGVGSYSDPDSHPGLAHFCGRWSFLTSSDLETDIGIEHMLFMGSENYPDVDEFPNLIALNTGIFNAYTQSENTNFHFEISNDGLKKTL